MVETPEYRLMAYEPWGDLRDEIFDHAGWDMTRAWNENASSTLNITHSRTAENVEHLKNARMRVQLRDPEQEEVWNYIRNGTFIPGQQSDDRLDPARMGKWGFVGIDALLYQTRIGDPTNPADTTNLVHTFDVGDTAGKMLNARLNASMARVGTGGDTALWGEGFTWTFGPTLDSLGAAWTWTLAEDYEMPILDSVGALRDFLVDEGACDTWWEANPNQPGEERFYVVNAGSGSEDRSDREVAGYTEIFDGAADGATESKDETNLATHALVEGKDGLYGWAWNDDAVSPFGRREIPVTASHVTDSGGLQAAARGALREGQRGVESIRRDLSAHTPGVVWVDRDYELGDLLSVERDDSYDVGDEDTFRSLQAVAAQVQVEPGGHTTGYVVLNSRQEQAVARIGRRLKRAALRQGMQSARLSVLEDRVSRSGITADRPGATTIPIGTRYYDTTLGKPIWSTGAVWKDAAGTVV